MRGAIPALAAVLVTIAAACGTQAAAPMPGQPASAPATDLEATVEVGYKVGDRAPEFTLRLIDGTTVPSAGLLDEGRPVFLFFFTTW